MAKRKVISGDFMQVAKAVADIATGEAEAKPEATGKNPAAVALGKLGGKKGGKARAAALTPEKRAEIAKKAAAKRWEKKQQ
jgi:hypothetical protein